VPQSVSTPWLFGPLRDLLLGCGLIYAFVFVALSTAGDAVRAAMPMALTPFLVLLTSIPHYGATLLRVYDDPADRRRYALFAVGATALLIGAFVVGAYQIAVGSFLVTLYLTWSPWHYSGQNYGIALLFLHRRGVNVAPRAKRCLHASFVTSFLLTAVMLHARGPGASYAPGEHEGTVYQVLRLGLSEGLVGVAMPVLALAWISTTLGALWLLRAGGVRALVPTIALVGSQGLWFALPAWTRHASVLQDLDPLGTTHATYAFLWIALTHAVQYLWITAYFVKAGGIRARARWSGKVLLAGAAVWVLPALAFAPGMLGRVPYDAGLGLLIAAVVNLHHFVLDGAIWKLRDGRIARILLRGEPAEAAAATGSPWPARVLWAGGTLCVLVWCASTWEQAFGLERALARGDVARVESAHERLGWLGQGSARVHIALAMLYQQRGDRARAHDHAQRGRALHPGPDALFELAGYHHLAGNGEQAIADLERALHARPHSRPLRHRLALFLAKYRSHDGAALARALDLARAVVDETAGLNATYLHTLAIVQAAGGDVVGALATAQRGLVQAEREGQQALADVLRRHVAAYTKAGHVR
jgi:hypothetical protein